MQQRAGKLKLNLLSLRRHYTNPHEHYNALRAQDGLYFDETSQSWLVTSHKLATAILDDKRFLSSLSSLASGAAPAQMAAVSKQMVFMDGDAHHDAQNVMLRTLAHQVKQMPDDIRRFAREALLSAQAAREMDAVSEFASPVSLFTIAHVLGIPVDDRELLRKLEVWSDTFGDVTSGYFRGDMNDIKYLESYFHKLIQDKRKNITNDLLSDFIAAKNIFPEEEDLVANCMMVFAAGRITTKKLLGNGIDWLMQHWDVFQAEVRKEPRFVKTLGEELLRITTPTRYLIREAAEDIELAAGMPAKQVVRRGQKVMVFLEAANYDPHVFAQPMEFNAHRRPNKHIAFGYGPHQCPGATLARIEIQVALEELFAVSDLRAKPGSSPVWNSNPNLGGYSANPVTFSALS